LLWNPVEIPLAKVVNLRINTLLTAMSLALVFIVLVLASSLFYIYRQVEGFQENWREYSQQSSDKHIFFNTLSRDLGYGGMIHGFKNYILREDDNSLASARISIMLARASVDNYRVLELSTRESDALNDISRMLDKYAENLEIAHLMQLDGSSILEIDQSVRVNEVASVVALDTLESLLFSVTGGTDTEANFSYAITRLRHQMGYGGMIHLFKNYVLRGEADLLEPLAMKFAESRKALATLQSLASNRMETDAIGVITATIDMYQANLDRVIQAHMDGMGPTMIDALVRVDDAPAQDALNILVRENFQREEASKATIALNLFNLEKFSSLSSFITVDVLLLVSLLVLLVIRKQVVTPITRTTSVMLELAGGKLDTVVPYQDQQNEIGDMNRALEVFRDAAVQQEEDKLELEQTRLEAERANAAKSEFVSSMSHELRTPLNAILGFAQLMNRDPDHPLTPKQAEGIDRIQKSGRHLLDLINQVLDLSRIESGKLEISIEKVNAEYVIQEAFDMTRNYAESRHITLTLENQATNGWVLADRTRFRQVLLNLLSNAVKYNRDSGSITVHCETAANGRYRVEVSDTGAGIALDKQSQVFTRFNRLGAEMSTIEGTGIGLSLSREIIKLMEGEMGFVSEPGKGSTFWFELPAAESPGDVTAEVVNSISTDAPGNIHLLEQLSGTLLYIEDNPTNMRLMELVFDQFKNLHLQMATTAELGLEMADSVRPDIIFLDINLPGMDGFEALAHFREKDSTRDIPIIAVSAHAMDTHKKKARAAGFDDYITKPFSVDEVLSKVASLLKQQYASQAAPASAGPDTGHYPALDSNDVSRIINTTAMLGEVYLGIIRQQAADFPALIDKVQDAINAADPKATEFAAHTLKTCAATFGARGIWAMAQDIESQAKEGRLATTENISVMKSAYVPISPVIAKLLEDLGQQLPSH
jgi:signal transduction histidine kinase/CheY-like chemotaxis protein/HPt (histidine-containing phosphotransfer) domain-containing protein